MKRIEGAEPDLEGRKVRWREDGRKKFRQEIRWEKDRQKKDKWRNDRQQKDRRREVCQKDLNP